MVCFQALKTPFYTLFIGCGIRHFASEQQSQSKDAEDETRRQVAELNAKHAATETQLRENAAKVRSPLSLLPMQTLFFTCRCFTLPSFKRTSKSWRSNFTGCKSMWIVSMNARKSQLAPQSKTP